MLIVTVRIIVNNNAMLNLTMVEMKIRQINIKIESGPFNNFFLHFRFPTLRLSAHCKSQSQMANEYYYYATIATTRIEDGISRQTKMLKS